MTDEIRKDYRDTVFLPKTDFSMKAGLAEAEPKWLARWQALGLEVRLRAERSGRDKFILHDGPPYANGDMHIGHALNHVLKDMVVRTQTLLGKDAPYVPGWDCHGLPIEWKVEEEYRKKGRNKDEVEPKAFRAECRAYAQHWVDRQREQLKRLGIGGDWDNPYLTMDFEAEATIVAELMKVAESGQLYRGAKPVMWSPVEKTALAEAEVEYEEVTSTQVYVAFEIAEAPNSPELVGAHAVIWTTTPWTLPVNRALAYGPEVEYVLLRLHKLQIIPTSERGTPPTPVDRSHDKTVLVARRLVDDFLARLNPRQGMTQWHVERLGGEYGAADLAGAVARHPWAKFFASPLPFRGGAGGGVVGPDAALVEGPHPNPSPEGEGLGPDHPLAPFFLEPRPLLPGDFVTTDTGTGIVHMAPDHGEDDFLLCKAHGIDPLFVVGPDGTFRADWPVVGGNHVYKVNAPEGPVCAAMREAGALLAASADYRHSYPHSWRSKAKVIFRCTPQWFVPMDAPAPPPPAAVPLPVPGRSTAEGPPRNGEGDQALPGGGAATLRQRALAAIDATRFIPERGRNRIGSMVAGRPDWVLSRQRAWGVPITLFVDKRTGEYLKDPEVNARIVAAVRAEGVDGWSAEAAAKLIGPKYDPADFEQVTDILDVWFDSGCTHVFVLESARWPALEWPADVYLEGSDQHRGWFQSSLLQSCATRGRAPYKAVVTHGFTMAADGRKMSKSLGNTIDPVKLIAESGADILRLWAVSVDWQEDHRIGPEIMKGMTDAYRKIRNTFRYLLGALDGFDEAERVAAAEMPELERWVLHRLAELDGELRQCVQDFDFTRYLTLLQTFCVQDLSAFYFDVRKDSLYCDAPSSLKRRSCRTALDTLFHALTRWFAPVLVFTAEEVWQTRFPDENGSVHLLDWPATDAGWLNDEIGRKWSRLREYRSAITEAIEPFRRDKAIGSSLEAQVLLDVDGEDELNLLTSVDIAELAIVAQVTVRANMMKGVFKGDPITKAYIKVTPTNAAKCARCWRHTGDVEPASELCVRCDEVVGEMVPA